MGCCYFHTCCRPFNGPRPLKSTGRHGHFLNSTCDIEPIDMRQGHFLNLTCDRDIFVNSTCDMDKNKRQRHATLAFLKIDTRHGDPPVKGPYLHILKARVDSFHIPSHCHKYVSFSTAAPRMNVIPGSGLLVWVKVVSVQVGTSCNYEVSPLFNTRWQHTINYRSMLL